MFSKYRNSIFAALAFICLLLLSYLGCFGLASSVSPEVFTQQALAEVEAKALKHAADWRLGEEVNVVTNAGTVTFVFADGTNVSAPMQIIGTYNIVDGTFMWSWGHPNMDESLCENAKLALKFGQENQLPNYQQPKVICTKREAWEFTATAAKLGNANGAYSGPVGNTFLFMTFGDVSLSNSSSRLE